MTYAIVPAATRDLELLGKWNRFPNRAEAEATVPALCELLAMGGTESSPDEWTVIEIDPGGAP
jgi:hypothetical protein